MQRYEAIESGIANQDVKALREAIGSICYTSRDFSSGEFDEAIRYVESKGIKIKDEALVGNPVISGQKSTFTDEDFAKAIFELKKNFCEERIQDVKTIGKKLYAPKPQQKTADVPISRTISDGTYPNGQSHQQKSRTPMIAGLVAAVIIVIVIILIMK